MMMSKNDAYWQYQRLAIGVFAGYGIFAAQINTPASLSWELTDTG
jgi:hypothetical protein